MDNISVQVVGLSKLSRELKTVSVELPKAMKAVSKSAAEVLADAARALAPVQSGTLRGKIKTRSNQSGSSMVIGGLAYHKSDVFGGKRYGGGNKFPYEALDATRPAIEEMFYRGFDELLRTWISPNPED